MAPEQASDRPIFWKELGAFFQKLRAAKGWAEQSHAANVAAQKRLDKLTRQVIIRLETGKTKNPDPEVLRQVAVLYGVPYLSVLAEVLRVKYGLSDVPSTTVTQVHAEDPEPLAEVFKILRGIPEDFQQPIAPVLLAMIPPLVALRKTGPRTESRPGTPVSTSPILELAPRRSRGGKRGREK